MRTTLGERATWAEFKLVLSKQFGLTERQVKMREGRDHKGPNRAGGSAGEGDAVRADHLRDWRHKG